MKVGWDKGRRCSRLAKVTLLFPSTFWAQLDQRLVFARRLFHFQNKNGNLALTAPPPFFFFLAFDTLPSAPTRSKFTTVQDQLLGVSIALSFTQSGAGRVDTAVISLDTPEAEDIYTLAFHSCSKDIPWVGMEVREDYAVPTGTCSCPCVLPDVGPCEPAPAPAPADRHAPLSSSLGYGMLTPLPPCFRLTLWR